MKSEIVYDGGIVEKRAQVLRNLASLVSDSSIHRSIKDAEIAVEYKNAFRAYVEENNIKSYVFFDYKMGGKFYPVIAVGDYGIAVTAHEDNSLFSPNQRIHKIETAQDISKLRMPWCGHPAKSYADFVVKHQEVPTLLDYVGNSYPLDLELFVSSNLWTELELKRDMIADSKSTIPSMVFKVKDVFKLLSLYPKDVVNTSPINPEYQKVIIDAWDRFLSGEKVYA